MEEYVILRATYGPGLKSWAGCTPNDLHPFECRWPTERVARFQPQGNRFYSLGDLPGKTEFDAAQAQLDRDMGTWEKLRDWVLAGANLYGHGEYCADISTWRNTTTEPLLFAAYAVLAKRGYAPATREIITSGQQAFSLWADAFSDRANRVDLWKN